MRVSEGGREPPGEGWGWAAPRWLHPCTGPLSGVFICRGKEDALVTKNLVPGESVYGEKRVSISVSPVPVPATWVPAGGVTAVCCASATMCLTHARQGAS